MNTILRHMLIGLTLTVSSLAWGVCPEQPNGVEWRSCNTAVSQSAMSTGQAASSHLGSLNLGSSSYSSSLYSTGASDMYAPANAPRRVGPPTTTDGHDGDEPYLPIGATPYWLMALLLLGYCGIVRRRHFRRS